MSVPIISEVCYTCNNCITSREVCKLKSKEILHIFKDKCQDYTPRQLDQCKLCEGYFIHLPAHVTVFHKKTMHEYNLATKNRIGFTTSLRSKNLWD
jgi:hypothetical protein